MRELTERAPAKLNLTLDILRRREDGYHDLEMVMTSVSLCDLVTVRLREDGEIFVQAPGLDLPAGEENLAGKAARVFFAASGEKVGADIFIEKHIPSRAGMAGGSSDAAAVLRALRSLLCPMLPLRRLESMGAQIGSDVPYCVRGGTVLAEGRGEHLTDWPAVPPCFFLICKPDFDLSTSELFARVRPEEPHWRPDRDAMYAGLLHGELATVSARLRNVFEDVLTPEETEEVRGIKDRMLRLGAQGALMTGSGPTVFGLFRHQGSAQRAYEALLGRYRQTFLAQPL